MEKLPLIIDCDPGQDDAVMLLFALAAADVFDVLGITCVAGNVPLHLTQRNARLMCELAGRTDISVYAGCPGPMVNKLVTAEEVHGNTGIDGFTIYEPTLPLQKQHAVDFIVDTLSEADENAVTLVFTSPLTNLGMAIVKDPAILPKIREIVIMGGAMREAGNRSPSAEFNILVDPHAAKIVFDCGRPVTAIGLDVTHQVLATPDRLEKIRNLDSEVALSTVAMLKFFNRFDCEKYGFDGAPLHDPCTVAYLLAPDLFKGKFCNVEVEIHSPLTAGHTAVDFWDVSGRIKNTNWLYEIDTDGFFELLTERLGRY